MRRLSDLSRNHTCGFDTHMTGVALQVMLSVLWCLRGLANSPGMRMILASLITAEDLKNLFCTACPGVLPGTEVRWGLSSAAGPAVG